MLNVHVHVKYMDFVWHLLWMKPAEWPLACILIAGLQMYKVHTYFVLCTKVHAWQFSCHGNYKWCFFIWHRGTRTGSNLTKAIHEKE